MLTGVLQVDRIFSKGRGQTVFQEGAARKFAYKFSSNQLRMFLLIAVEYSKHKNTFSNNFNF
jgi:hypothetical protein